MIGRSNIVGRPMSVLLSSNTDPGNCTVTLCHSHTKNIKELCREADIVVAALGRPGFVTSDMIKEGAIVIDVGITRVPDASKKSGFALKGDVDFATVSGKCSYITPVPGGVGPMTIAALICRVTMCPAPAEKTRTALLGRLLPANEARHCASGRSTRSTECGQDRAGGPRGCCGRY